MAINLTKDPDYYCQTCQKHLEKIQTARSFINTVQTTLNTMQSKLEESDKALSSLKDLLE